MKKKLEISLCEMVALKIFFAENPLSEVLKIKLVYAKKK